MAPRLKIFLVTHICGNKFFLDLTTNFIKKFWHPELGPMGLSQAQNDVFCHFLKPGLYVLLEIECDDNLQQCLRSSRSKTYNKKIGTQIWVKWSKSDPKLRFLSLSQVLLVIFPLNRIGWCLTTSRVKTHEKKIGDPKLDLKLGFSSLSKVCFNGFPWYCAELHLGTISNIQ